MRSVLLDLQPRTFDDLVDLARSIIPTVAPAWTDHNTHDPGIMLAELVAWVAEAQGYALSRVRRDERLAYAQLLGITARGPVPARGLVWPLGPSAWAAGTQVTTDAAVTGDSADLPAFHPTRAITLTGARLSQAFSIFGDGTTRDWTRVNVQDGATFLPFGNPVDPASRLCLRLQGDLVGPGAPGADAVISIGVEIVAPEHEPSSENDAPKRQRRSAGNLAVELEDVHGVRPLAIVADTTQGLLHSGVLLLSPPSIPPSGASYTLSLHPGGNGLLRAPRLRRIALDVLPVVQLESIEEVQPTFGTGMPDQSYALQHGALVADDGRPPVAVDFDGTPWTETSDLGSCRPADTKFELDRAAAVLHFGNGVDGRAPPEGATLRAAFRVTAGASGNVLRPLSWSVQGILGTFGTNSEPLAGGSDAQTLTDLRRIARHDTRSGRPLVTSSDLVDAALALCDLAVARAYEPSIASQPARQVRGVRTLIVVAATEDPDKPGESAAWLAAIRERLAPRLPLGQSLVVRPPRYVHIGVRAHMVAQRLVDPADVVTAAETCLRESIAIVSPAPDKPAWPFGRDVAALTLKGWLRTVAGVARVTQVELKRDGASVVQGVATIGITGLPVLRLDPGDIVVDRAPSGTRA